MHTNDRIEGTLGAMTEDDGTQRPPGTRSPRGVATMRDIAIAAEVSQRHGVAGPQQRADARADRRGHRARVVAAAKQLGYRPNPLARGLRGAATMLIGAVVRDITDPFFAGAIEALSVESMARGYNVVLGHAHGRADEAFALTAVLETRHCDAIVLLGDMQDQPRLLGGPARLRRPRRRPVAGIEPPRVPTVASQGPGARGLETSSASGIAGSRS